ncbi:MAG: hypothetical protein RBJ76_27785 [Stenomitos frigidus ULC029]
MNLIWSRFLRSAYRSEPITSFIITAGIVEATIGGLGSHWTLMTFGLGTVGIAIVLRWWQQQRRTPAALTERSPVYALPSRSSRSALPTLRLSQKASSSKR